MPRRDWRMLALALALVTSLAVPALPAGAVVRAQPGYTLPEEPFNLELLSEFGGGTYRAVEASGGCVFALRAGRLEVRENTATAPLLASTDIRGVDLYPYGNGVMVLREGGFAWVECSDPASPAVIGEFWYSDHVAVTGFAAGGRYAYFSYDYLWGGGGTKVVDLSNPAEMHYVAYLEWQSEDMHGDIRGDHLYVRTDAGFDVVSLVSPKAPAVIKSITGFARTGDLVASGSHLYLAYGDPEAYGLPKGLRIYSLASPANPAVAKNLPAAVPPVDVAVSGSRAWLLDCEDDLLLYNVSTPSSPATEAGHATVAGPAFSVAAAGQYAHVLSMDPFGHDSRFETIDGRDPSSYAMSADSRGLGGHNGAAISGSHACVCGPDGFSAWDITDPTAPTREGEFSGGLPARDVQLAGARAYLACGEGGLQAVSGFPSAPVLESTWTSASVSVEALALEGGYLFAASASTTGAPGGLLVFDVTSDPDVPALVGSYRLTGAGLAAQGGVTAYGDGIDVAAVGRRVWLTTDIEDWGGAALLEIDVTTPTAPVARAQHGIPGDSPSIAVRDGLAYCAWADIWGSSGVKIFSVATTGALAYQTCYDPGFLGALDVACSPNVERMAFTTGADDLRVLDAQVPSSPYLAGYQPLGSRRIAASGDLVITTHPDDGARLFRFTSSTRRSFGTSRYDTAVSLSRDFAWADTVVIATGRSFPDALAGAPLAHALDAPILLVGTDYVPASVKAEIARLGATRAVILGGEKAVGPGVVSGLVAAGIPLANIERISGADRYQTARLIAEELDDAGGGAGLPLAFIASGASFPDALAAGGAAAALGAPLLLVRPASMPAETSQAISALGCADTVILGGNAAVGSWADTALPSPERIQGSTRYETARAIADWALANPACGFSEDEVFVATGRSFADALPCGAVTARRGAPTLLASTYLPPATRSFISDRAPGISGVRIVGGAAAIPATVEWEIAALLR